MAGEPITRNAAGALVVPLKPSIPVLVGDAPETWDAAKKIVEAAVKSAYKGARQIDWRELPTTEKTKKSATLGLPPETATAVAAGRVALVGSFKESSLESPATTLRRKVDASASFARVRSFAGAPALGGAAKRDVLVAWDGTEHASAGIGMTSGSFQANGLLQVLKSRAPETFAKLRFGSKERTDSYLRSIGKREPPTVDVALGLNAMTRTGVHRAFGAAVEAARAAKRKNVLIVHRAGLFPLTESGLRDWAYQAAEEQFQRETFTSQEYLRIAVRLSQEAADAEKARQLAAGAVFVDDLALGAALEGALSGAIAFDVVFGNPETAALLLRTLAAAQGGVALVPTWSLNAEKGIAIFGTLQPSSAEASPAAMALAAAEMLSHLGWLEASTAIVGAVEATLSAGRLPAELARLVPGSKVAKPAEFAAAASAAV